MNFYVQGSLHNNSLHAYGMPRPLRGRLMHGGRSAFVCERQLPFLNECGLQWFATGWIRDDSGLREYYIIRIRDNSGLVEASQLWKSPGSSWYPTYHAWKIIGYDLQKWKDIGNNVPKITYHSIPPLCKMISEICYSFPLVRYKYCLFADIDIDLDSLETSCFRFSTSDVVEQSILGQPMARAVCLEQPI